MCHVQGNGDVWCGRIKLGVRKRNDEVATEKEIKPKSTTTRYIYRIYKGVQVDVQSGNSMNRTPVAMFGII